MIPYALSGEVIFLKINNSYVKESIQNDSWNIGLGEIVIQVSRALSSAE